VSLFPTNGRLPCLFLAAISLYFILFSLMAYHKVVCLLCLYSAYRNVQYILQNIKYQRLHSAVECIRWSFVYFLLYSTTQFGMRNFKKCFFFFLESSCLHRASIVSKHFLLFQLMHTIINLYKC
jgi:hypothetical protein